MAWDGDHPVTKKPWKKRLHERSEENLKRFADALVELLEENDGVFIGHLRDILIKAGLDDTYYGDLVNDIEIVKKRLRVKATGPNRHRRYEYENNSTPKILKLITNTEINKDEVLDQIRFLLNNRDISTLTYNELKSILNIIKVLCRTS